MDLGGPSRPPSTDDGRPVITHVTSDSSIQAAGQATGQAADGRPLAYWSADEARHRSSEDELRARATHVLRPIPEHAELTEQPAHSHYNTHQSSNHAADYAAAHASAHASNHASNSDVRRESGRVSRLEGYRPPSIRTASDTVVSRRPRRSEHSERTENTKRRLQLEEVEARHRAKIMRDVAKQILTFVNGHMWVHKRMAEQNNAVAGRLALIVGLLSVFAGGTNIGSIFVQFEPLGLSIFNVGISVTVALLVAWGNAIGAGAAQQENTRAYCGYQQIYNELLLVIMLPPADWIHGETRHRPVFVIESALHQLQQIGLTAPPLDDWARDEWVRRAQPDRRGAALDTIVPSSIMDDQSSGHGSQGSRGTPDAARTPEQGNATPGAGVAPSPHVTPRVGVPQAAPQAAPQAVPQAAPAVPPQNAALRPALESASSSSDAADISQTRLLRIMDTYDRISRTYEGDRHIGPAAST